ncbi:hypothetical protein BCR44DRAFT_50709 [Catenaria anguillulae PL171]|uniref:F-box domain-containing protein n=1 Tax=Catenaria anguillulae PL171 TaxID=765915 RepID=A0A1Y2HV90_9FUNG|nr:hypothetical protein BCR44DRAFT_50709 [Catenaria anguillulae PL171]
MNPIHSPHAFLPTDILLAVLALAERRTQLVASSSAVANALISDHATIHAWVYRIVFCDPLPEDSDDVERTLCTFLDPFDELIDDFRELECTASRAGHDDLGLFQRFNAAKKSIDAVFSFSPVLATAALRGTARLARRQSAAPDERISKPNGWQGQVDLIHLFVFFLRIRHLDAFSSILTSLSFRQIDTFSNDCDCCLLGYIRERQEQTESSVQLLFLLHALVDLPPLEFFDTFTLHYPLNESHASIVTALVAAQFQCTLPCPRVLEKDPTHFASVFRWVQKACFNNKPLPFFACVPICHNDTVPAFKEAFMQLDVPNLQCIRQDPHQLPAFASPFAELVQEGFGIELLGTCIDLQLLADSDIGRVLYYSCKNPARKDSLRIFDEHVILPNQLNQVIRFAFATHWDTVVHDWRYHPSLTDSFTPPPTSECNALLDYVIHRQIDPIVYLAHHPVRRDDSQWPWFSRTYSGILPADRTSLADLMRLLDFLASSGMSSDLDSPLRPASPSPNLELAAIMTHHIVHNHLFAFAHEEQAQALQFAAMLDQLTSTQFTIYCALTIAFHTCDLRHADRTFPSAHAVQHDLLDSYVPAFTFPHTNMAKFVPSHLPAWLHAALVAMIQSARADNAAHWLSVCLLRRMNRELVVGSMVWNADTCAGNWDWFMANDVGMVLKDLRVALECLLVACDSIETASERWRKLPKPIVKSDEWRHMICAWLQGDPV